MLKENLIKNLSYLMRNDAFINELFKSIGAKLDNVDELTKSLNNQLYFDSIDYFIPAMSKNLGIEFADDDTIGDKRSIVEAKWKSSGKSDIFLIQRVLDAWKAGVTEVDFTNGKIIITFPHFVPVDLVPLDKIINEIKPAHLPFEFIIKYNTFRVLKGSKKTFQNFKDDNINILDIRNNKSYFGNIN